LTFHDPFESFSFVIFVNIIELPVTARTLMFHHTCRPQSEVHFSALPDLGPSCAFVGQFFHTRSRVGGQTFCQCCLPLLKNLQEFRAKFLPTQVFQQSKEDHTGKRLYLLTIGYKRRPPNAGFEIKSPQAEWPVQHVQSGGQNLCPILARFCFIHPAI